MLNNMTYRYCPNQKFFGKVENIKDLVKHSENGIEFNFINASNNDDKIICVYKSQEFRDLDFERIKKKLGEKNDN